MVRVFLDANVYFAGCYSAKGASALLLKLAVRKRLQVVASRLVLREAERNLHAKADRKALRVFHRFLETATPRILRTPSAKTLAAYETIIHPKDVPVLAAAVEAKVDYLVTLDRRHFFAPLVEARIKSPRILAPGDFLQEWLSR
ncbi:MAG TPA: putative toxin-antitoxin system toxin component, PIN family [Candidatus Omnitrophica bacterium]|nr:MAG: putative toxin-antitoxin system toxin component, PIN family [Omnitrophica WOR_2 bacterium GWA2_63_20]OGX18619.1 MAG: putative toxin-antitoxin system toxin component, PIN family [Omnitrophica WOR_2 bacterium GWF2_63_9]OGX33130.1 MAG: putative toxin-antitoxin system toxin component, PIN family [Omnitrophica WOR_2 bacterium RIFCSPHIGHO2_12_FULL_64_13]OGX36244.1 MAG: putative toxin-antitoxin system toxin component, PIN family [Omnitrophica WOR_2 bacterium RIFCSPHIGHO2_02_FULL_63_39]OGX46508